MTEQLQAQHSILVECPACRTDIEAYLGQSTECRCGFIIPPMDERKCGFAIYHQGCSVYRNSNLAEGICEFVPSGPERTVALRKLLESKDAAVRASVFPGG